MAGDLLAAADDLHPVDIAADHHRAVAVGGRDRVVIVAIAHQRQRADPTRSLVARLVRALRAARATPPDLGRDAHRSLCRDHAADQRSGGGNGLRAARSAPRRSPPVAAAPDSCAGHSRPNSRPCPCRCPCQADRLHPPDVPQRAPRAVRLARRSAPRAHGDGALSAGDLVLCFCDLEDGGGSVSVTNGVLGINIHSNGLITLT